MISERLVADGGENIDLIAKSFTYNGRSLDSKYALGSFDTNDILKETSIKYNTNKTAITPFRSRVGLYSTQFADVLTFEVTILKCNNELLTETEIVDLVDWLTPMVYHDFIVVDFPESTYHKNIIYHAVSLGYDEYIAQGGIVALKFYFECDAPYGFAPEVTYEFTGGVPITIDNKKDDYMDTYPVIHMTCGSREEVSFRNNQYPEEVMKLQVKSGQVLTIDTQLGIIEDTLDIFDFGKDTNLVWLHLAKGTNIITITGNVTGTITYQNLRKRGI